MREMKKAVIGLSLMFCAIDAPEIKGYYDQTVKMSLAGYIDKTDELYIQELYDALTAYNETLSKNNKPASEEMTRLILDALWFKQFWRILGNDPYIANWVAELYATLVYCNHQYYDEQSLEALAKKNLNPQCPGLPKDTKKAIKERKRSARLIGSLFPDYHALKNTIFGDLSVFPSEPLSDDMRELINQKCRIIDKTVNCLKNFHIFLNSEGGKNKAVLQAAFLPYDLMYNIQANDRVFEKIRQQTKIPGVRRDLSGTSTVVTVDSLGSLPDPDKRAAKAEYMAEEAKKRYNRYLCNFCNRNCELTDNDLAIIKQEAIMYIRHAIRLDQTTGGGLLNNTESSDLKCIAQKMQEDKQRISEDDPDLEFLVNEITHLEALAMSRRLAVR